MKKVLTVLAVLVFMFAVSSFAGWQYVGPFPADTTALTGWPYSASTHGLAVDPEGKVWVHQYYAFTRDSVLVPISTRPSKHEYVRCIYVYNRDGSPASFSPIKFITVDGVVDTVGGFTDTSVSPAVWRVQQGVGLRTDGDGNIMVTQRSFVYRLNYKTGEGMAKIRFSPVNNAGIAVGVATQADNKWFIGTVLPGNPIQEYDKDFNYLGNVVDASVGYSRTMEVSPDGNTVYWTGYSNNAVYVYARASEFDAWQAVPDTVLKGFACESVTWHPTNGLLYFAAGSWLTPANKFPGAETNYRTASWYGVDVTDWTIKDQIDWTFTPKAKTFADSSNERPRALAFSVTGDTCYLGTFDRGAIQMLVKGEAGPVDVTFRINMHVQEQYGNFNPATDKVVLRGSLNGWAGDADELLPTSKPGVYALTKTFPADQIGTEIEFKYVKQPGDVWENVDNRKLTIPTSSTVLPIVFFNNVETYTEIKTANVTFQADVSDMIAKGFTAGTDELLVLGVFNGWAYNDEWITQPDLVTPTLYTLTHAITDVPGTVMGWKFRGRPEANFADSGWEGGDNHTFTFTGEDLVLDAFKPNVTPAGKKLSQDVTVTFSVNTNGAKDYYNKKAFPTVEKVIINGDFAPIGTGGWAGWSVADIGSTLISMYDDGTNGDVTAGDGIWTCQVLFAAGSTASHYYKYGIYSTGYTDTLNAGTNPMDNEAGFAMNHVITISDANPVMVLPTDKFGSQWVKVERIPTNGLPQEFALSANYPNPFNPTTYITYDLPAKSHVRLTVFNAMGQIVSRLVDKEQTAGSYRVSWNGTNMDGSAAPSGIYFYRLEGDGFAKTMKMTLMK